MQEQQKKKQKRYFLISFGLHLGLFLFLAISSFVMPHDAQLILPSIQVDMVALPDHVKGDTPVIDPTQPVKEQEPPPPPEEKEVAKPAPKAADDSPMALEREREAEKRAKQALERMRKQMKKEQAAESKKRQELLEKRQADLKRFEETYRSAIKGNQANQGTSASGALGEVTNAYTGHVMDKVRSNWGLPAWLQSQKLRAVVHIRIDSRGNLISYNLTESSGNQIFDDYVTASIKKSNPFAPPPQELAPTLRNPGMEVLFPL
jgi:protein TonB